MDKRKVAREARNLAMECVTGEAPPLIKYQLCDDKGSYCVAGLLGFRVDGSVFSIIDRVPEGSADLRLLVDALIEANNSASDKDRHGAVVFPLLALADACDAAAASEPERA